MEKYIEILVDHKEYITKEEAYKVINEQYHETGLDGYQDGIELMNHIAKIPAVDVVEIIRCKDCMYWMPDGMNENEMLCTGLKGDYNTDETWYCPAAKRRETEL